MTAETMEAQTEVMNPAKKRHGDGGVGRAFAITGTGFAGIVGLILLVGGLGLFALHSFSRDGDGYYTTSDEHLQTGSYAVTTDRIDLGSFPSGISPSDVVGNVRVSAESRSDKPVFVGIARTSALDRYLRGVGHSAVTDVGDDSPTYQTHAGRHAPPGSPAAQSIWVASSQGAGEQKVDWDAQKGVWSVAVMNADGSRGVSVDANAGAKIGWLIWVAIGLTAGGLVVVGGAAGGMYLLLRDGRVKPAPGAGSSPGA